MFEFIVNLNVTLPYQRVKIIENTIISVSGTNKVLRKCCGVTSNSDI